MKSTPLPTMRRTFRVIVTLTTVVGAVAGCERVDSARTAVTKAVGRVTASKPSSDSAATGPESCPIENGGALVNPQGIGPVQLGGNLDDLKKLCVVRDSSLRADEGQPAKAYAISVGTAPAPLLIFINETTRKIRFATSTDTVFKTSGGVGIGSTVGKLRSGHGRLCGDLGPTGIEVWAATLPGVVFGTTAYPPKVSPTDSGSSNNAIAVPDTAHITTVAVSSTQRRCSS